MARIKKGRPPAKTPEARENQLIAAAIDLAEKKILDGTASNQVILHYLKLGTSESRLRNKKLEEENKLLEAKTEQIKSQRRAEELFANALDAMRSYSGGSSSEFYDENQM